jgi:signal transduction histidine kinase
MTLKYLKLSGSILLISVLFICNTVLFAQSSEVEFPLPEGVPLSETLNLYQITSYPQNWAITRDKSGNLIVGTGGGIYIYDGARWQTAGIPGLTVRSLAPSANGKIFAGGSSEFGYFRFDSDQPVDSISYHSLVHLVPETHKQFRSINNIIVRPDSSVIFNGVDHSFHYKNGSIDVIGKDIWVFRLFEANEMIFSNDSLGLSIYENGELNLIPGAEEFEYTGIYCVLPVDDSSILFAVRNRGLFIFDGENFINRDNEVSRFFSRHYPYTCQRLPDNSYIAGTLTAGAVRFNADGAILGHFDESGVLPENTVYNIYSDGNGTVWLSHFEHVTRLEFGLPIRVLDQSRGYNGLPLSLIHESDGTLIAGTQRGVYISDNGNVLQPQFREVLSTQDRSQLLTTDDAVLSYTQRYLFRPLHSDEPVLEFPVMVDRLYSSVSDKRLIYAVMSRGLFIIVEDDGVYNATPFLTDSDLSNAKIVQNESGDLWIGSSTGTLIHLPFSEVKRFLEEGEAQVKQHDMPDGWRGDGSRLITLALDEDDVLIGTPRGLYRIDRKSDLVVEDNRFGNLSRMNEYGSPNPIFHLENDGYGNIWIRSSRKYQYAEKAEDGSFVIHQNIPGRIDDNVSNAIVPDGPGRAWFLGSEGIVYFDHNLSSVVQAGSPVIRRVTSRSDSLLYQGYNRQKSELMELVLPYELNDFRIEFGFPDFNSFDDTEYEVQLEGFDEGWSIWNTEAQKDYTQVREGRYRFMVRAKAGSGYVTEAAVLSIRILPPWYRTIWAYLFYISAVSFLLFSMHKYRVNRILEIQQVRNRIASDLHDDVSATLSSITFFTQAIERNRNSDKAAHYLNLISESAGEAKEKMSDIIWSINPEHDNWENLISKCKRYAADLLESKNIQYELSFPDQGRGKVGIELRQNIWLIFKELITNIARHSNAEHVEIEFFFSGQELKVRVSDNGDGFEANELKQGNGIGNIKNRVAELGGVADLKSEPETGTVWMISLPV